MTSSWRRIKKTVIPWSSGEAEAQKSLQEKCSQPGYLCGAGWRDGRKETVKSTLWIPSMSPETGRNAKLWGTQASSSLLGEARGAVVKAENNTAQGSRALPSSPGASVDVSEARRDASLSVHLSTCLSVCLPVSW